MTPDTYAYCSTVVAAFQQGLYADDVGVTGIGFATSHDRGRTWNHGSLPGITTATGGRFSRALFPSVGYERIGPGCAGEVGAYCAGCGRRRGWAARHPGGGV